MAITSTDQFWGAARQGIPFGKTQAQTSVASQWTSVFDRQGNPGAGTLNPGNTANGLVHTDATAGYPSILAFGAGNEGYLSKVDFGNSVACRIAVYDRQFVCGAHVFNANQALTSQPDFSSRVPNGDYGTTELWYEQVAAGTGVQNVNVTYEDEGGSSKSTGTIAAPGAMAVGRCFQLPLAAGGKTLKKITNVVGTVATAGTFNIMILRELWSGVMRFAGDGGTHGPLETGMREMFEGMAVYMLVAPASTNTGVPDVKFQIKNG